MAGPLPEIDTVVAGINLDVQRALTMGPDITIRFLVPDTSQFNNWKTLLVLSEAFCRMPGSEVTRKDGSQVIYRVADLSGALASIIRSKDLHVEVEGQLYSVGTVPPVASNVAQVFTLTCKVRTIRGKFEK